MSSLDQSKYIIVPNQENLSEEQKLQFNNVVMEGIKGKFSKILENDTKSILAIIHLWIQYGFLPMDETFCVLDNQTGEVLSILLLNNFKKPTLRDTFKCIFEISRVIGIAKTLKMAFEFNAIDNLNKEVLQKDIIAEIYLVSTREDQRGKGIGTIIINHALAFLNSKCKCGRSDCVCKAKLLVFAQNPALKLYERMGFYQTSCTRTPKIARAFGESYDAMVRMEKQLITR